MRDALIPRRDDATSISAVTEPAPVVQAAPSPLKAITKVLEIEKTLPDGVTIDTFYNRTDLVDRTIWTVARNLGEGGLLVIAVLLLLPVLNTLPHWYVKETFGRQLHTDLVLFNPFTLSAEVRGAALPETDGEPFAALDKARVNLSLSSLWRPGWVLD